MNSLTLHLLMAGQQASPDAAASPGGFVSSLIPFAAIIAIFYFLIIRPQGKKRKETEKMLAALKKGDKVVTIGGVHGTIQSVREATVIVRVDDNVKIEFSRSAVSAVQAAAIKEDKNADKEEASEAENAQK